MLTFPGTPHAKHLLSRLFLDGSGPKLVSKVSDSYDADQQNSKKQRARAPSRAKSDDPLNKKKRFWNSRPDSDDPVRSRGNGVIHCGSDPPTSHAGSQDDGSCTNSFKLPIIVITFATSTPFGCLPVAAHWTLHLPRLLWHSAGIRLRTSAGRDCDAVKSGPKTTAQI